MNILKDTREKIDLLDEQIAKLFVQRMDCSRTILDYKRANDLPIFDSKRENEVIAKNCARFESKELVSYYRDFLKTVMQISKEYQNDLLALPKTGYQGIEGGFGHNVATKLFDNRHLKSYPSFAKVIDAIENNEIVYGILPLENSYAGDVNEVFDLLFNSNVFINDVYHLKVKQNLLGIKGSNSDDINCVISHPQAINQCIDLIRKNNYQIEYTTNTALGAKQVARCGEINYGAIASVEAAEIYGLDIIKEDINNAIDNQTKFVVLSNKLLKAGNHYAIMFTLEHGSGKLAVILNEIAKFGLDMTAIKSRATKLVPWQYYFYVEIAGNWQDTNSQLLLESLKKMCKSIKIVGTYTLQEETI